MPDMPPPAAIPGNIGIPPKGPPPIPIPIPPPNGFAPVAPVVLAPVVPPAPVPDAEAV